MKQRKIPLSKSSQTLIRLAKQAEEHQNRAWEYQRRAAECQKDVESALNAFMASYAQKLRELGTDWAGNPVITPPKQVSKLICQALREIWGVKEDPCLPQTVESIVSGLLQAATGTLIGTLSEIAVQRAMLIRLLQDRLVQISQL